MESKTQAAAAILLVQATLMLGLGTLSGLGIGALGLVAWLDARGGTPDWTLLGVVGFVMLAQGALLVSTVLAAGWAGWAAVRGLRGDPSLLRAAAMLALGATVLNGLASLISMSCCLATSWSVPGVLGIVAVALALEAAAEAAPRESW